MPMRYRRFSARFVQRPGARVLALGDPWWTVSTATIAAGRWRPPMDVCESADRLTVVLELAGLEEERTDVVLYADALIVEGDRVVDACADRRYHRAEIRQGRFTLTLPLPFPVVAEGVTATYERGLLRIELPRAAADAEDDSDGAPTGPGRPAR